MSDMLTHRYEVREVRCAGTPAHCKDTSVAAVITELIWTAWLRPRIGANKDDRPRFLQRERAVDVLQQHSRRSADFSHNPAQSVSQSLLSRNQSR